MKLKFYADKQKLAKIRKFWKKTYFILEALKLGKQKPHHHNWHKLMGKAKKIQAFVAYLV